MRKADADIIGRLSIEYGEPRLSFDCKRESKTKSIRGDHWGGRTSVSRDKFQILMDQMYVCECIEFLETRGEGEGIFPVGD